MTTPMHDNADYDQSCEPLSERVLADAIRDGIYPPGGVLSESAEAEVQAAAEACMALVVAERLALTTQIKARLESEASWVDPQLRFDLVALVEGAAPTSEQTDATGGNA